MDASGLGALSCSAPRPIRHLHRQRMCWSCQLVTLWVCGSFHLSAHIKLVLWCVLWLKWVSARQMALFLVSCPSQGSGPLAKSQTLDQGGISRDGDSHLEAGEMSCSPVPWWCSPCPVQLESTFFQTLGHSCIDEEALCSWRRLSVSGRTWFCVAFSLSSCVLLRHNPRPSLLYSDNH